MAPEVCKRLKPEGYSAAKAEVWSLGCTLFTMAYQRPPFTGDGLVQLFQNIEAAK